MSKLTKEVRTLAQRTFCHTESCTRTIAALPGLTCQFFRVASDCGDAGESDALSTIPDFFDDEAFSSVRWHFDVPVATISAIQGPLARS